MRIVLNELKKVLNIKSIFFLCIIGFVIYSMFIRVTIRPVANEPYYTMAIKLIKERGTRLEEKDLAYLKDLRDPIIKEIDKYLSENKETKELGIISFEKLNELRSDKKAMGNEKLAKILDKSFFKEKAYLLDEISGIDPFISKLEDKDGTTILYDDKAKNDRKDEIKSAKSYYDIMPSSEFIRYSKFICNSALLVIVSIAFILAPIFTKDKLRNIEMLQYTTRRGRSLYKDKIITALVATFLAVTLELSILFTLLLRKDSDMKLFFNSSINSFLIYNFNWFDLKFLQYITFSIILVYIAAFALALIICYVSRKANRYITLIGVTLLITIFLGKLALNDILGNNGIGNMWQSKFLVPGFICCITLIGIILVILRYKKEKALDMI